ncbi:hypothetical protein QUA30_13000 [Microcoleus sp. Pol14C2]|uniref:hypothetical protein n=1 Tax=unclassified Microcoleus TaxID=2642155 RepID=UPI002FCED02F
MVFYFVAVAVFLAVVFFATVFSVAVSDFTAAVLVGFFDLLLVFPCCWRGYTGSLSIAHIAFVAAQEILDQREVRDKGFGRSNAQMI